MPTTFFGTPEIKKTYFAVAFLRKDHEMDQENLNPEVEIEKGSERIAGLEEEDYLTRTTPTKNYHQKSSQGQNQTQRIVSRQAS
jgi:hypothetical protein